MWLVWAFDAVLLVLPIGREQLRDLVYVGRADTPKRPCCVADGLTDLELVITHTTLLLFASHRAPPPRRNSIVPPRYHKSYYISRCPAASATPASENRNDRGDQHHDHACHEAVR